MLKPMQADKLSLIEQKFEQTEALIEKTREQVASLQASAFDDELAQLRQENESLKKEVAECILKLSTLQSGNAQIQVVSSSAESVKSSDQSNNAVTRADTPSGNSATVKTPSGNSATVKTPSGNSATAKTPSGNSEKSSSPVKSSKSGGGELLEVDIGRLDLRVGRILSAEKHADADSLYVEKVDVGEDTPRTVVSGLVRFVPLELMQNRLAVLLCNLKPSKMRGVTSQAMVMCASTAEAVEILSPPADSVPGDVVTCAGFQSRPDAQLNPKKKIFEQVAVDLKTDDSANATYRGVVLEVVGKGHVTAESLKNASIK